MDRTLLFLAYFFPPRGGAGVQRSVKFAKYLPQFGWKPLVIAHGGMADNASGVKDPTLLKDLPPDHIVRYTALSQTEKDSYFRAQKKWRQPLFATDPMAWWAAPAARLGMELAAEHNPAAIFVTMSPFTAAGAGIELKKKTGLPLILDLRDPWALDETKIYTTRLHARHDRKLMQESLAAADLIIMNTPESAAAVESAFGKNRPANASGPELKARVISITNGYDAEDFEKSQPKPVAPDALRIVHTGMFHAELAEVWDRVFAGKGLLNKFKFPCRPINLWTRTPRYLLAAIEKVVQCGAIPKDKIELVLVGEITEEDQKMIDGSPAAGSVKVLGYRSHGESVNWVESADVLFLPLHTPKDGGAALIVPGKAYEYLGSGRPILAMGPPGDMRNFVELTSSGIAIAGDDTVGAATALAKLYESKKNGAKLFEQDKTAIQKFERKELTARLADELNQLTRTSVTAGVLQNVKS